MSELDPGNQERDPNEVFRVVKMIQELRLLSALDRPAPDDMYEGEDG
jgi:hypothetical protein